MLKSLKSIAAAGLVLLVLAGCGQKGPLFLPGNPSEVRPVPEQEQARTDRDEEKEDERARVP
jgi:predicted small lipoprotein YifL